MIKSNWDNIPILKMKIFKFFPLIPLVLFFLFVSVFVIVRERQGRGTNKSTKVATISQEKVVSAVLSAQTSTDGWVTYKDPDLGISYLYPKDFLIEHKDSDIFVYIQRPSGKTKPSLQIVSRKLSNNDSINTQAEKDINEYLEKGSVLIDTINPISIGSVTGITFQLSEKSSENTYYYIPLGNNKFVEIISLDEGSVTPDIISILDRIVYSITLN